MHDHVVLCGFGRNGRKAAEELHLNQRQITVIDNDQSTFDEVCEHYPDLKIIKGDATEDEVLKQAGIEKAQTLITTLPSDADNVFMTLTAKELNPDILVISELPIISRSANLPAPERLTL